MNGLVFPIVASLAAIAVVVGVLWLAGHFGDRRANQMRDQLRGQTPYTPPANSRPNDFDRWDRPL